MNTKLRLGALVAAVMFTAVGCDLAVVNPNQPDRARALASPDDVENLIGSAYSVWWGQAHYWSSYGAAVDVASDHGSSSWGNFGMRNFNEEPRKEFDNNSSSGDRAVVNRPWADTYAAISAASDGLRAIVEEGLEIGPGGERNNRAIAWAKFSQALAHCTLALLFDQAFLIDETTDLSDVGDPVPYPQVMAFAIQKFNDAISTAQGGSAWTTENTWMNGNTFTNSEFMGLMRDYMARCKANAAHNASDLASYNWADIMSDLDQGRGEDLIIAGNEAGVDAWWDGIKNLGGSDEGWVRGDMHFIGQSDNSGEFQAWINTTPAERLPFSVTSVDQRIAPSIDGAPSVATRGVDNDPYTTWNSSIPHPPSRGTYTLSHYLLAHNLTYTRSGTFVYKGPIEELLEVELDLIRAEGLWRTGDIAGANQIINGTRVGKGGLTPMTSASITPEADGSCIPYPRFSTSIADCGTIEDALLYEHMMEIFQLSGGLTWYATRRFGRLVTGTPLQLPIPGRELEVLELPLYSFGGGGAGSAPSVVPGDLDSTLRRVAWLLDALELRQQRLNDMVKTRAGLRVR